MARAPKTNTTATENKEATAPEGETAAPDQVNEGANSPDEPVKDPDGNTPDPDAPAPDAGESTEDAEKVALGQENERLQGELARVNDELTAAQERERVANITLEETRNAANPLAVTVQQMQQQIDELTAERDELLNAEPVTKPDPDDTDIEPAEGRERVARGYLLGIVLAMPENYRLNGQAAKLDELEQFVSEFDGDDRYIAVELIKAIAEARPNDIPNGRYILDVRKAFAVLDGVNEAAINGVEARDEQLAAFNRLAGVVGASPVPAGFVADRREREDQPEPVLDGSLEQNAAAGRLYSAAG